MDTGRPTRPPSPRSSTRSGLRRPKPREQRRWWFVVSRVTVTALVGWLSVGATLFGLQRTLLYLPDPVVPPIGEVLPGGRAVAVQTDDGLVLPAWWMPAPREPGGRPAPAMVVFHGVGGNRAYLAPLALGLADRGVSVLLAEYRGYGEVAGSPTEEGLVRDARAALAHLRGRADVDPDRIAFLGDSLGTGVAVRLAVESPPRLVVLRSPYTSLPDVAAARLPAYPYRSMMWDRFETIERIGVLDAPVLVVVGDRDDLIPPEQSRAVYEEARRPIGFDVHAGHDHFSPMFSEGPAYLDRVAAAVHAAAP